ncbi:MAG: 30S ribosomal protein S6 [Nitrospiraceae bacterium]|nr:30S ribosomal protein S6 [Nitrospiraceae bacterium]
MNYYENIVILDDTLPEEDLRAAIEKIKGVMQDAGGQIVKTDEWGMRKLAYELNKHKRGFYVLYNLKAPATAIQKLEEFYRIYDPVMKHMVIKLEKKQTRALEASIQAAAAAAAPAAAPVPAEAAPEEKAQ